MHTAEIFRDLKNNLPSAQNDPDLLKIEKIGKVGNIDMNILENENDNDQLENMHL
jgi:hypothetical protein